MNIVLQSKPSDEPLKILMGTCVTIIEFMDMLFASQLRDRIELGLG